MTPPITNRLKKLNLSSALSAFLGAIVAITITAIVMMLLNATSEYTEVIVDWISVLISTVGLWLIYRQLKATEKAAQSAISSAKAAEDAAQIALSGTRPWIKLTLINEGEAYLREDRKNIFASIRIIATNIGKTPATNVVFHSKLLTSSDDDVLSNYISSMPNRPFQAATIFPDDARGFGGQDRLDISQSYPGFIRFLLVISYQSPGGKHHISPMLVEEYWDPDISLPTGHRQISVTEIVRKSLQPT